jgi:uncharacterized protein (TIGR03067 family)
MFVVNGNEFTVLKPAPGSRGRVTLDTGSNPKRIQFEVVGANSKPDDKKGHWIYELEGDELRMASFTDSDGSVPPKIDPTDRKQMVWKAKRVKD